MIQVIIFNYYRVLKNTINQKTPNLKDAKKIRDGRGRIVQLTRYRDRICQSDSAKGETCAQ